MTANVPAAPKPQIMAGGAVAALVPQSLDEAFRVAHAIAASGLAPKGLDRPEQVLVAIMAGAELGFAPFQAMQSFAVINGKPNIWGDALPALLWSNGFKLKEWFDNDDEPTKAFCRITRPDGEVIERTYSLTDAKKANLLGKQGPWQTNQKRMLQMRARSFGARDGASDVLRGMHVAEEVQDYQPFREVSRPAGPGLAARLSAPATDASAEGFTAHHPTEALNGDHIPDHDTETGEVIEATVSPPADDSFPGDREPAGEGSAAGPAEPVGDDPGPADDHLTPKAIAADWHAAVAAALPSMSEEEITAFLDKPDEQAAFARLEEHQPQLAMDLNKAITARRKELAK